MKIKTILRIIVITFIISLLVTCKKTGRGFVKGTVKEMGTGTLISGAMVTLSMQKNPGGSTPSVQVNRTTTDVNGDYLFYFTKEKNTDYYVNVTATNYNFGDGFISKNDNKETTKDIELSPYAYIKFRFKKYTTSLNYALVDAFPSANASASQQSGASSTSIISTPYKNYPYIYDTILPTVYATLGNQPFNVSKEVFFVPTQTPDHSSILESIYINKGETLTYLVDFN